MNKGGRILVLFSGVLVLWAIMTVVVSMHTVHSVHKETEEFHYRSRRREHSSSLQADQSSHSSSSLQQRPLNHVGGVDRWKNRQGALMEAWTGRQQQKLSDAVPPSFRHGMKGGGRFESRNATQIQHVAPKVYDASILEGQPTICVERDNVTQKCHLQSCASSNNDNGHDDFGFVLHKHSNTRGQRMFVGGTAKAGSGCALSHTYKFIYIHVLKSGGMTMKSFLKKGLCHGSVQMPCEAGNDVLQIVDCGRAVMDHPDYFIFSFIRNPFGRMYSAYSMAESMRVRKTKGVVPHSKFKGRERPPVSLLEFATMTTFQRRYVSVTSTSHYEPQVRFLFDRYDDCPVFDYVGRLERFQHDLQVIVRQIDSPALTKYYNEAHSLRENNTNFGQRRQEKELGGKLSNAFNSTEVIQAVVQEFRDDFEWLRYDAETVP